MAPEQCRGVAVDHRADLYSLGCILFEACAGRPPFIGEGAGDILAAHIHVPPPALSSLAADAPPELVAMIEQLLIKDRAARTQSADAVALAVAPDTVPAAFALGSGPRALVTPQEPSTTTILTHDTAVEPSGRRHALLVRLGCAAAAAVVLTIAIHARARRSAEATGSPSAAPAALVAASSSAAPPAPSTAPTETTPTADEDELLAYGPTGAP